MSEGIWTACVGTPFGADAADEALNLDAPDAGKLIAEFVEKRPSIRPDGTEVATGKTVLPVKEGKALTLFYVEPMPRASHVYVMSAQAADVKLSRAFAHTCFRYQPPGADEKACVPSKDGGVREAPPDWMDTIFDTFGSSVINEIGNVALVRAVLGPKVHKRGGFSLPPGLIPAR